VPIEISVGPPVLTINQGNTFMVTDQNGEIAADSEQGVYGSDTRFVNYYAIFANGQSWTKLTSSATSYYAARIYLANQAFTTEDGDVPSGMLGLVISRSVTAGILEELDITNYSLQPVHFNLEVALRSDFADLFEVKSHHFVRRGSIETSWDAKQCALRSAYDNRDFHRRFTYQVLEAGSQPVLANGRISFDIALPPGGHWHARACYVLTRGRSVRIPTQLENHTSHGSKQDQLQAQWLERATKLACANEDVHRLYNQSVNDMGALRMHEHDLAPDVWVPAAGVPWYVALFGRDSLIASLQNMMIDPGFALGALKRLAEFQATEIDDYRDAQPGKILHELRTGELAHFHKIPHTPYYGTADATILYLIVLHEAWKWSADMRLLHEYGQVAQGCLDWIDQYGDLDGDGFQEYQTHSPVGYDNMGWKDAGDAVVYPDGSQVKQPKALCELQGYVFDTWMRMAEVFDALGDAARSADLRRKATDLQARFEERFWCEDIGCYAYGLDPGKQPIRTIASNAGQCLWSGIASPEHAERVVRRFLQPDMSSGWGLRTLSAANPAFNPFSYQLGSVWPHDNGIIALGFKRYGFAAEAAQVAHDVIRAASFFVSYRVPELYAGVQREPDAFPVLYLGANVPQAWAAGSIFHFLQALLGLQADAPNKRLFVAPSLPSWLPEVALHGMKVGKATVDLRFWLEGEKSRWEASVHGGKLEVEERSWGPWPVKQTQAEPRSSAA